VQPVMKEYPAGPCCPVGPDRRICPMRIELEFSMFILYVRQRTSLTR